MSDLLLLGIGAGGAVAALLGLKTVLRRGSGPAKIRIDVIAEQVRTVGKIIGLEVSAKEIATATKGFGWLPPLLLSQARVAMIFHFEKQYGVDLTRLTRENVKELGENAYRLMMPPVEGALRRIDVTPYDIQDGRLLGLLDVIQMNAASQKELMSKAQEQAAALFDAADPRYRAEARRSIEKQITTLLSFVGAKVEIEWPADDPKPPESQVILATAE